MRRLLKQALRHPRLVSYLRDVYLEAKSNSAAASLPETVIPEANPIQCRPSEFPEPRLNLLVPALAIQHVFGGISTALSIFKALGEHFPNLRIILTEQHRFTYADNSQYLDWEITTLDASDGTGRKIIPAGDRNGQTLAVSANDRFVATAWWTACTARHIQLWQAEKFGMAEKAKYVYLIQDYEPGFYAWSSRYALAEATYHNAEDYIAVFNTRILRDYFVSEGYHFPLSFTFDPTLNPVLRKYLQENGRSAAKERRMLVYGRPGVERNAFQIVAMALSRWAAMHPEQDWELVSAGEVHQPIELGHGKKLVSLGKLSLEEYAHELARASVGISLMISPHPSYPPLEMAAFGVKVITNTYKSKDLSTLTPDILSIKSMDPDTIAQAIDTCIAMRGQEAPQFFDSADATQWQSYVNSNANFDFLPKQVTPLLFDR